MGTSVSSMVLFFPLPGDKHHGEWNEAIRLGGG